MLHYSTYILSETSPWVTFIHGAGGSSSIWFRQIKDFKKSFNVLLVDLRGHGRSKKIDYENLKRYTFDKIGDDVMEVLNHLQIKQTHFVGISLGTIIIREITERFPERTLKMVLGGAVMKLNIRGQILMRLGAILQSVVPYLLLYKLLAFVIMPRKKHKESRNLFINEAKKLYQREFKRWFTLVSEVNPLLSLFRIKDSGVPTLYIMGEEDYMFLPSIQQLVKNHLSSQLHIIPACGHVVNVEKPDEFNRQALQFLESHESN
ncbi:MAG: alpha/beta fold hydrolase [Spirosomataceae bacterium]